MGVLFSIKNRQNQSKMRSLSWGDLKIHQNFGPPLGATQNIPPQKNPQEPSQKQAKLETMAGTVFVENSTHEPIPLPLKKRIDSFFTMAIASSTTSHVFVENNYFRKALKLLNPGYKPMSRNQSSQNISQLYAKLVAEMQKKIDSLSHFSLCIDFW